MIAAVALSADALLDTPCSGGRLEDLHRRLAHAFLAHGLLVFASTAAERYFVDRVKDLGTLMPSAAKCWEAVLIDGRAMLAGTPAPAPVEHIYSLQDLEQHWSGVITSAVMERERAELVGLPEDATSWCAPTSKLEVVCHDCPTAGRVFGRLEALDQRRFIRKGTKRMQVWDERIAPLLLTGEPVHILDRYLGRGLDAYYSSGASTRRGPDDVHELQWLLRRIVGAADKPTISVYTQAQAGASESDIAVALEQAAQLAGLTTRNITKLQLFAAPPPRPHMPHDRHIRVGRSGIEFSAGFDRLRSNRLHHGFTATYYYGTELQKLTDAEDDTRALVREPVQIL